jgi:hypothetical protein
VSDQWGELNADPDSKRWPGDILHFVLELDMS